jgi:hypothetical protein
MVSLGGSPNHVQPETDTRNTASARVLEKLGFVREVTLREDCIVNGEVSDSWVYGLLRRQWKRKNVQNSTHSHPYKTAPFEVKTRCCLASSRQSNNLYLNNDLRYR